MGRKHHYPISVYVATLMRLRPDGTAYDIRRGQVQRVIRSEDVRRALRVSSNQVGGPIVYLLGMKLLWVLGGIVGLERARWKHERSASQYALS